ncbi:MAG: type III polyketide synthase [Janthinobacterium lividum]
MTPHLNRVATAVPPHDVHEAFVALARTLLPDERARTVFERMAERSGIAHRFAVLQAGRLDAGEVDTAGFYRRGAFPSTAARMRLYEEAAPALACEAVAGLHLDPAEVTHLVVASCTGFSAPGLDLQIARRLGLRPDVERTLVGFMGCAAAVPALRAARHIVRSEPEARVLVVCCELSSLHLQESAALEEVLSFLLFADGAAAALVTAEPHGLALEDFRNAVVPDTEGFITWHIGDAGFRMHLSGRVPGRIAAVLRDDPDTLLRGTPASDYGLWAVHAGGRTILDAVEQGLALPPDALRHSRAVLHDFGNMSSATVLFVLDRILREAPPPGTRGLALAFGPGMVAESFQFRAA